MSPTIITFTSEIIDSNSIKLYWTGTYDTITLEKSINDSTFTTVQSSYSGSSYTFTGLNSNTVYYFRITPYDSSSTAGSSESLFAITPMTVTINTFSAGTTTTNSIPLYWSGSYYKVAIYYKRTIDTSYKLLTTSAGTSSYNVTNLSADTSYNFYITPYNLNNEAGTSSSIITGYTDYNSYISNFYLGNITSSTVDLSWNGQFSFIKVQKSSDGGSHYITDTKLIVYDNSSSEISSAGSCTISDLSPYTYYYFRLVPYSENYNVGTTSSVVYGRTLMGISTFSNNTPGVNSATLTWSGVYTKVAIKKIYNNNTFTVATVTNSAADTTQSTSDSYTITNLSPYTSYTFFLLPYNNTTSTTKTSSITITTDFSAQLNPYISNLTYSSVSILFDTSGASSPYYSYVLVEYSTDGGSTYSDLSYVSAATSSSSPYTYVADDLSSNTEYYFRVTPYSLYDVAGTSTIINTTTEGYISAAQIYLDSSSQIVVDFSGVYSYVSVKYGADSSVSGGSVTTTENSYTFSASDVPSSSAYYFSVVPYNTADVSGDSYTTLYNPSITYFYVSSAASSTNTLVFGGNYTKVLIQQASRTSAADSEPTTYTDVSFIGGSGAGSTNTVSLSGASTSSAIYYRAIPYYNNYAGNDASGAATDAIYVPIIDSVSVDVNGQYDICLNWTGIYDYAAIQYASYGTSTYYDICANYATSTAAGNTYHITGSDRDFSGNSYKFRVIPYSYADASNIMGIYSETYNASISSIDASANSALTSDINTAILYFTGNFDTAYIYFREDGASYGSDYIEAAAGSTYASIGGLTTNTKYYFQVTPYNEDVLAGMPSQEDSVTTRSMLTGLDLSYSAANSSSTAVYFTWNDTGYTYFDVYDSAATFLQRFDGGGQTYYNSDGIESLSSNTTYTYTIYVYDSIGSTETATVEASTLSATSREMNMTALNYASGVTFTWEPVGYKEITIQNVTTAAAPCVAAPGFYDSYANEDSTYFLPNTQYTYEIQTTCDRGNIVKENKTITTAAELTFAVLYTTNNSVCIRVRGAYSGFAVYAGIDPQQMEVVDRKIDVYPARIDMPTDLLYYYPFDTNMCDYSSGYAAESCAAEGSGTKITQDESTVGLGSLYLPPATGVKLPARECAPKTLAMWFKHAGAAASSAKLFDFVSSTNSYRRWYLGMDGTLYYCYEDDAENIISTEMQISLPTTAEQWTHIAITIDADIWSVYINGSHHSTKSGCLEPKLMSTDYNYIGKSFIAHDEYYNGYIEDLRIYSRTLYEPEIKELYNMAYRDFTIPLQRGATYYLQLAPQNGAGEYGELTTAQIVTV